MRDAQRVIACDVCGRISPGDSAFCITCRSRLSPEGHESSECPRVTDGQGRSFRVNQRTATRIAFVAAALALAAWLVYINVGPFRFLSAPTSSIGSIPGPGEWAMSHRGPDRNAFVESDGPIPRGIPRWSYQSVAELFASPTVVDNRVYLATGDGRVVALDATSGETRWEFAAGDSVKTSPAVAGDSVFVGLQDGRVVALDKDTGGLLWEFMTGNPVLSSPVVYEGTLYIGSNDWRLYALDAATGEERWSFRADDVILSGPAIHAPVLAFTDVKGKLYVLDLESGKRRFDYQAINGAEGGAVFSEDRLFLADLGGRVRAVDWTPREFPFEKNIKWFRLQLRHFGFIDSIGQQKGFVWFFLVPDTRFVTTPVVAHNSVYAASTSGKLVALDRESSSLKWEFHSDHSFESSPSMLGETLFAADSGGLLYAIDALNGQEVWRMETASPVTSTPVLSDGVLYLTTRDGTLYALE